MIAYIDIVVIVREIQNQNIKIETKKMLNIG
jgi:hypothetical protein